MKPAAIMVSLEELIPQAKEAAEQVAICEKASVDFAKTAIQAAVKTGEILRQCKAAVGHGRWGTWLAENLPAISQESACRWMRLAKLSRVTDLTSVESLSEAYRRCGILPEKSGEAGERTKAANPRLSAPQAALRAGTTLQKRLRLLTQQNPRLDDEEANQLRLLWGEIQELINRILGEVTHEG